MSPAREDQSDMQCQLGCQPHTSTEGSNTTVAPMAYNASIATGEKGNIGPKVPSTANGIITLPS